MSKTDSVKEEDKYDPSSYKYDFDKKYKSTNAKKESSLNFYKNTSQANENKNSTNHFSTLTTTNAFKKKNNPSYDRNSAISEKWEEENICSTSHGSTHGKTYLQNLDADILEDMAAYGMEYPRGKVK